MNITRFKNIVFDSRTIVPAVFVLSGAAKMYSDYKIAKPEKKKSIFIKDATILTGSAVASLGMYYLIKKTPGYEVINNIIKISSKGVEKIKNTEFIKNKVIPKIAFLYKPVTATGNAVKYSLNSIERAIKDCIGGALMTLSAFGGALGANEILTKLIFRKHKNLNNTEKTTITTEQLKKDYTNPELISVSSVGPTMGKELFKNSLLAVTLAFLGIVAYLSFRFRFDYALAAILGVLHDVIFVCGIFSILGIFYNVQIDGLFITAILTVIGFSVHDTIVVFDRIRENLRYYSKKMSFGEIVDASVNQTLTRSINTSLTTLITLLALYFFGGVTTKDFVLCMILGIAIGTYSSIFFCSMLVDFWNDKRAA